ncbi:MAG: phosphopantetheine-binding protein [Promethearchaeota archaeon]
MENKIKELFATILKIPLNRISDNLSPDQVEEWDSLNHLNLISSFEEEFSIEIEPEEIIEMNKNYKTLKTIILKKLDKQWK